LCDAALEELFRDGSPIGVDLFDRLIAFVTKRSDPDSAPSKFYSSVCELPPPGIRAADEQAEAGRAFFLDYSIQILQALLYYSLAGGFARSEFNAFLLMRFLPVPVHVLFVPSRRFHILYPLGEMMIYLLHRTIGHLDAC